MTAPEFTPEQVAAAREYEASIREQANALLGQAVEAFTAEPYNLDVLVATEEVAIQALTRGILLFGMLPQETQELLKDAPLITSPSIEVDDVEGDTSA